MHISKLAVCTLAAIATQDFVQSASAAPLSATETTPEVNPRVVSQTSVVASFTAVAIPESIANVQVEFSQTANLLEALPHSKTSPQIQPAPTVAQTTTIDELEEAPPPELPPEATPDSTNPPSGTGQYLQNETPSPVPTPSPTSPPASSSPSSPAVPSPSPSPNSPAPSSLPTSPTPAPAPASSGLTTEPIAPTVQIGDVVLPHRGALPANFAFPIRIQVTVDSSITTNNPITNSVQNLASWEERVRACLDEKPQIFAVRTDGSLVPILFDGQQGRIIRNANGRMVCAALS